MTSRERRLARRLVRQMMKSTYTSAEKVTAITAAALALIRIAKEQP